MSDDIHIVSNASDIMRRFSSLRPEIRGAVKRGIKRGLILAEEEVRRKADVKFSGGRSGLASRLTSHVVEESGAIAVDGVIGFRKTRGFPYEMSQEYGAKAKAGGAMAIPVSAEAKKLSARGISAKDFPGKLFRPSHSPDVLMEREGLLVALHYVLRRSIPARLHFRSTVTESLPMISREIVREYRSPSK